MKTTIKNLSETKVELRITVGADELVNAQQVATVQLAKSVKVPGFRKGHAPASVAAKYLDQTTFAQQVLETALNRAIAESFVTEKIQVLDRPEVDVKKYVPGQELEFVAVAEVLPKITLGDYKKLSVKKQSMKVADDEIESIVDRMRQSFATKTAVDRAAKDGDEVVIDFVGKDKDGVAFEGGSSTDYKLTLGSNTFIPGFEAGIVGKKPGDSFVVGVKFPDDYYVENLKGQKSSFDVTLKTVNEIKLPEVNDEFAAKCGPFTTSDEMRADIKRELTDQKDREAGEKLKDQLVEKLIELSKVPVPEILLADQKKSIEQDLTQNLMYQGMTLDQYLSRKNITREEWENTEVLEAATRRVKAGLVLAEVTKAEAIEATDAEIDEHVEQYKERYKDAASKGQFNGADARRDIANRLITEKTVDRLVELNTKE